MAILATLATLLIDSKLNRQFRRWRSRFRHRVFPDRALLGAAPAAIYWDAAKQALAEARGIPTLIGLEVDSDPSGQLQNNYNMPTAPGIWRW